MSCDVNTSDVSYTSYPNGNLITRVTSHRRICKSTPNYFTLKQSGAPIPAQPYTHNSAEINYSPGHSTKYSGFWTGFSGYSVEDGFPSAYAKAVASYYDNASKFETNVLVTLAELPMFINLVGNTAKKFGKAFGNLKSGNVDGAFGALGLHSPKHAASLKERWKERGKLGLSAIDFASGAWLELQYGWLPTLYDIQGVAEDLVKAWDSDDADVRVRGSGKVFRHPSFLNMTEYQSNSSVSYKCGITGYFRVVDNNLRNLAGLGITNPLEVVWERTLYSFVVDWFLPIGSFLKSLRSTSGMEFIRGSTAYVRRDRISAVGTKNGLGILSPAASMSATRKDFERKVLASSPARTDMLRPRGFDDAIGITRAISGIALLAQAFGRHF